MNSRIFNCERENPFFDVYECCCVLINSKSRMAFHCLIFCLILFPTLNILCSHSYNIIFKKIRQKNLSGKPHVENWIKLFCYAWQIIVNSDCYSSHYTGFLFSKYVASRCRRCSSSYTSHHMVRCSCWHCCLHPAVCMFVRWMSILSSSTIWATEHKSVMLGGIIGTNNAFSKIRFMLSWHKYGYFAYFH